MAARLHAITVTASLLHCVSVGIGTPSLRQLRPQATLSESVWHIGQESCCRPGIGLAYDDVIGPAS
jgi:hypothetical protein